MTKIFLHTALAHQLARNTCNHGCTTDGSDFLSPAPSLVQEAENDQDHHDDDSYFLPARVQAAENDEDHHDDDLDFLPSHVQGDDDDNGDDSDF